MRSSQKTQETSKRDCKLDHGTQSPVRDPVSWFLTQGYKTEQHMQSLQTLDHNFAAALLEETPDTLFPKQQSRVKLLLTDTNSSQLLPLIKAQAILTMDPFTSWKMSLNSSVSAIVTCLWWPEHRALGCTREDEPSSGSWAPIPG